jgi:4-amino-4-deoxy-L-arabinose transferase-like glycosyltransferase
MTTPSAVSTDGEDSRRFERWRTDLLPWAAGAAALLWLSFSLGARNLTLPDEGRYVGIAWEMLRSGNWLIPTENGLPFFHKPPLFYWLTAASMNRFGTGAAAARLAPLLAAALGALGLYRVARHWAGEPAARWSVLVLLTEPFFFGGAQFANLDMPVAACIALSILSAAHAALLFRSGLPHRPAVLGAWAAAAFGVLAKGLIGVALPGMVVLVWLILSGQRRAIVRLCWPAGPALFALIAVPWFLAVQARYPGFAHYFFVYQHFERFAKAGFNNVEPWWFFAAVVPALTIPWSFWLLRSTFVARPGESSEATLWRQLMWVWLGVVLVFFSIPQSKPVGYAMPMLFPLAALCADAVLSRLGQGVAGARIAFRLALASAIFAMAACVVTVTYFSLKVHRDNTVLAETLLRLRGPGEPVVFVDEYFFDVPLHAQLSEPVPVLSDWHDSTIALHDNWKRELAEAAAFAPRLASALLVDQSQGFALRCGGPAIWAVVKSDDEAGVAALPGARRVVAVHQVGLWRIGDTGCTTPGDR